jgi:hypothetical protein
MDANNMIISDLHIIIPGKQDIFTAYFLVIDRARKDKRPFCLAINVSPTEIEYSTERWYDVPE